MSGKVSNQRFVSGKLSKCSYIHRYTHLITSSALNEKRVTRVPPRDFAFWAKSLRGQKSSVRDLTVGVPQGSSPGLAEILRSHGLDYHFYADDTQLYISFKDCDVDVARLRVENCVADICHWMEVNELKLNH